MSSLVRWIFRFCAAICAASATCFNVRCSRGARRVVTKRQSQKGRAGGIAVNLARRIGKVRKRSPRGTVPLLRRNRSAHQMARPWSRQCERECRCQRYHELIRCKASRGCDRSTLPWRKFKLTCLSLHFGITIRMVFFELPARYFKHRSSTSGGPTFGVCDNIEHRFASSWTLGMWMVV